MNEIVYFLRRNEVSDEYGYGYVYDAFDGSTDHFRSAAFQNRIDMPTLQDPELFDIFECEAKLYIGEHSNIESGMNELLDFWFIEPTQQKIIYEFVSDSEALKFMNGRKLDYLFYHIKCVA